MTTFEKENVLQGVIRTRVDRNSHRIGRPWRANGRRMRLLEITIPRYELVLAEIPFTHAIKILQELQEIGRIRGFAYDPSEIKIWAVREELSASCPPKLRVAFDRKSRTFHYGRHSIAVHGRINIGLCAAICNAEPGQWVDETEILDEIFNEEDTVDRRYSRKLRDGAIRLNKLTFPVTGRRCFLQEGAKFRVNV